MGDAAALGGSNGGGKPPPPPARTLERVPVDEVDLILLEALAQVGMVDGAARTAGLVESVARRRLARLESRLGLALLVHNAGGTALTTAGHVLLSAGRRLLSAVAYAAHHVAGHAAAAGPDGPQQLRLAAFGRTWDAFTDDLVLHLPGVLLDLTTAGPEEALALFERRSVDAVYAWQVPGDELRPTRPARVEVVLDEPMWVALPAAHPYAGRPQVRLADLADGDWVVDHRPQSRRLVQIACAAAGFRPRLGPAARGPAAVRSLVGQGRGIALVSPLTVPPIGGAGLVLRPLLDAPRRPHVLALDPALGRRLSRVLRSRLRYAYAAKAAQRNPGYLRSVLFPAEALADDTPDPPEPPRDDRAAPAGRAGVVPGLDLEDLHMLKVVAASSSLNRAAPLLMITQPALSRRIQRLENRLGTALFVRGYGGTRPSPAAYQLLTSLAEAEKAFCRTLDTVRGAAGATVMSMPADHRA